jgi:hypothetical protein
LGVLIGIGQSHAFVLTCRQHPSAHARSKKLANYQPTHTARSRQAAGCPSRRQVARPPTHTRSTSYSDANNDGELDCRLAQEVRITAELTSHIQLGRGLIRASANDLKSAGWLAGSQLSRPSSGRREGNSIELIGPGERRANNRLVSERFSNWRWARDSARFTPRHIAPKALESSAGAPLARPAFFRHSFALVSAGAEPEG